MKLKIILPVHCPSGDVIELNGSSWSVNLFSLLWINDLATQTLMVPRGKTLGVFIRLKD